MDKVFYTFASVFLMLMFITLCVNPGTEAYEDYLLQEITINNNTYVIVDYSLWDCSFTLDSGVEVDKDVVYQLVELK